MKLSDLKEMAVRGGDLTAVADSWAEKLERSLKDDPTNKEVGKIDSFTVRQRFFLHSIWDGDELIAAFTLDNIPSVYCKIDDVWVKSDRRGQKMFVKILLFIKNELKCHRIVFGEVHSNETVNLLKSDGLKAFKKHWQNRAGEIKQFSPDTVDDFYGVGKWLLVLESGDDWSRFIKDGSFTHSYEALAQAIALHEQLT